VLQLLFKRLLNRYWGVRRPSQPGPRGVRRERPAAGFRPRLESLEDRVVPSTATHFLIWDPAPTAQVGQPTNVFVIALDSSNHIAADYTGTIQLTDSDAATTFNGAALPTTFTFQASDHGFHDFVLTPGAAGMETLTATDTSNSSLTGVGGLVVNPAQVATHFLIWDPAPSAQVGQPTNVFVIALDATNHIVTNYTGTIQLTDTDTATTFNGAALPTTFTFQASDHGFHDFVLTPGKAGMETLTATDTSNSSLTGVGGLVVNPAPVATHFLIWDPALTARVGKPTNVFVIALDATNHIVPNYAGTIQLTDTDAATTLNGAALPTTFTFQASDHGFHDFVLTPGMKGIDTITATDTSNSSITGTDALQVSMATHFLLWDPDSAHAGQSTQLFVIALDAANQIVSDFAGTVRLSSLGGILGLPSSFTFQAGDQGFHGFMVSSESEGFRTVEATDASNPALTGLATMLFQPDPWHHHGSGGD
jgi:hypothetical protein